MGVCCFKVERKSLGVEGKMGKRVTEGILLNSYYYNRGEVKEVLQRKA